MWLYLSYHFVTTKWQSSTYSRLLYMTQRTVTRFQSFIEIFRKSRRNVSSVQHAHVQAVMSSPRSTLYFFMNLLWYLIIFLVVHNWLMNHTHTHTPRHTHICFLDTGSDYSGSWRKSMDVVITITRFTRVRIHNRKKIITNYFPLSVPWPAFINYIFGFFFAQWFVQSQTNYSINTYDKNSPRSEISSM